MDLPDPEKIFSIIDKANDAIDKGLSLIDKVADKFDRAAEKFGPPQKKITEETKTKPESEEECPVCSDLTDLKEFLGKRKVAKALSELQKGEGDKEKSLETVRKYIEGEEIV